MSVPSVRTHALSARDLTVELDGRRILDGVSLDASPGVLLAVTGPSGAGKTTLLHVVAGVRRPTAGTVEWRGWRTEPPGSDRTRTRTRKDPDQERLRHIGLVPQTYGLVSTLTAAENVQVALLARQCPANEVRERSAGALDALRLADAADRLVEQLSGGQQQRVAIARALAVQPDLVLADEPTSELDPGTRDLVLQRLRNAAEGGAIVIVATHDPEVAACCDETLTLHDGRRTQT